MKQLAIWILVFPILAPNTPRKILTASLGAASMPPLVVFLSTAAGATSSQVPPSFFVVYFAFTTYLCAGMAYVVARIVYRFGVRLTESQNGFRALKTTVARELDLREDITTIEQEMTIKTLARKQRLVEIPTHEYARRFGESKIKLSRVAFRYVYSWLKYLIRP